jgi:tripartite-type tricarboxylate transporter receptor subunit TctC
MTRRRNMMKRSMVLFVAVLSAVVLLTAGDTSAATWPEKGKVINFYVGAGAGGGSDMAARLIAQFLEPELGVKFIIINKPPVQAAWTEFMQKSGKDGYTMMLATIPSGAPPYIDPDRKAIYGRKDFQLVANHAWSPAGLAVKKGKYKSLKELVDAAKANPGKIKITAAGPLTPADFGIIVLEKTAGISVGHMFFDQQGEQRAALLGEHVDCEANISFEFIPGQKSGEIETLAILDTKPNPYLPGVKTAEEQGYKNTSVGYGAGIAVKTGTPQAIIDRVAAAVEKIGKTKEYQDMCQKLGLLPEVMTGKKYEEAWSYNDGMVKAVLDEMKKKK